VEDKNQSLADAAIAYARLGALILLKVRPYREKEDRYLVFMGIARALRSDLVFLHSLARIG
ncbi:MAG: DNA repair ATPase, partial [Zoogloeaceae bacterium]|nr:DNA repair ATPase [Zoogloeaceae bacterium]